MAGMEGRTEVGPEALGHRRSLGDARWIRAGGDGGGGSFSTGWKDEEPYWSFRESFQIAS